MEAYIRRGDSEIHWEGEKLNHFDLIKKINNEYPNIVRNIITRVKQRYSFEGVQNVVEKVDINLPAHLILHKLPTERKEFVIKLITLRIEKLINITQ
jgi:uncharacterized protein YajQ (UPF0234 family)